MWNIDEATDEQRGTMVTALLAERAVYEQRGQAEDVAAVQVQLDLWSKPTKRLRQAAAPARRVRGGFNLLEVLRP
jgi:hypothetical protein